MLSAHVESDTTGLMSSGGGEKRSAPDADQNEGSAAKQPRMQLSTDVDEGTLSHDFSETLQEAVERNSACALRFVF